MRLWISTASALALAASPALAQGNGNGNGNRGGPDRAQNNGNGNSPKANREGQGKADRENRGGGKSQARDRQDSPQANRGNAVGNRKASDERVARTNGSANRASTAANVGNRDSGKANGNRANANGNRDDYRNDDYRERSRYDRRDRRLIDRVLYRDAGLADGCPPGLAKKQNGCLPPGQAKKQTNRYSDRYSGYSPSWWGLPYSSGNYFYDDGYLMQYNNSQVSGYIPLLGGALSLGNDWPGSYGYDRVPDYYSDYYGLGDDYRYADNVMYRLDPETTAITSIAGLLTGDEFTVGQQMPRGYDVYNVPYSYRDQYSDRSDAMYRYSDGYVYEIDPTTRLVSAAMELLI